MPKKTKRGNGEGSVYYDEQRKRFRAQIVIGRDLKTGKLKRKSISGKTRKEVIEKMRKIQVDIDKGDFTEKSEITVGEWLDLWLDQYKINEIRENTYDSYEGYIRNHIKPNLCNIKLHKLEVHHIQQFYNHLYQKGRKDGKGGLNAKTVQRIHTLLSAALEQAVENKLISRNVVKFAKRKKMINKEFTPLTANEVIAFIDGIRDDYFYSAFVVEVYTGLRRSELLGLKWEDIDLKKGIVEVKRALITRKDRDSEKGFITEFKETKTAKSKRSIPIGEDIIKVLDSHRIKQAEIKMMFGGNYNNENLVFCNEEGNRVQPTNFSNHFRRLLKKCGLPSVRFHDLRHTFATLLLEQGENPKIIQELLGHSNIQTTLNIYSHVDLEQKKRATDSLSKRLGGIE